MKVLFAIQSEVAAAFAELAVKLGEAASEVVCERFRTGLLQISGGGIEAIRAPRDGFGGWAECCRVSLLFEEADDG